MGPHLKPVHVVTLEHDLPQAEDRRSDQLGPDRRFPRTAGCNLHWYYRFAVGISISTQRFVYGTGTAE
jgi:hypothetical protein